MLKYLIAASVALTPVAASAQTINVVISLERHSLIQEAAKTICRAAIDRTGSAVAIMNEQSAYLKLNQDERLYLNSLCILYAQGRIDEGR